MTPKLPDPFKATIDQTQRELKVIFAPHLPAGGLGKGLGVGYIRFTGGCTNQKALSQTARLGNASSPKGACCPAKVGSGSLGGEDIPEFIALERRARHRHQDGLVKAARQVVLKPQVVDLVETALEKHLSAFIV